MKKLHINVVDKIATYKKRDGEIVCGNSDYLLKFAFDSEWDSYTEKTARFIINGLYTDVDFTGDTCAVPMVTNADLLTVGVYAGDLCTSTPAIIYCQPSILCESSEQSPQSAEYYTNEAKAAAERAEAAAALLEGAADYIAQVDELLGGESE